MRASNYRNLIFGCFKFNFFFFKSFVNLAPDFEFSVCSQEFRQKVMLGTPFLVIWLVGFIADLDIDSWLIKGVMYAAVWLVVQFLSKYDTHAVIPICGAAQAFNGF